MDELLAGLSAVAIEGPKAVGKTATALQRAQTVYRLDDQAQASLGRADPARLVTGATPILVDEWQKVPEVWDVIRRAVDEDPEAEPVHPHGIRNTDVAADAFWSWADRATTPTPAELG